MEAEMERKAEKAEKEETEEKEERVSGILGIFSGNGGVENLMWVLAFIVGCHFWVWCLFLVAV